MGTVWVKELTGGLDTRRLPETTPGGVLTVAKDGHVTRGGEFEKRPAFVSVIDLPEGSVGLAYSRTNLLVFGSEEAPAVLPPGVEYQRLRHPDETTTLINVTSSDLYSGKSYVVGEFADGSRYHFYDGTRVADWYDGRARASFRVIGGDDTSSLTSLKVDGVPILTGPVAWETSNEATATAIAAAVTSYSSTPEFTATSYKDQVNILANVAGTDANGAIVSYVAADGLVISAADDLAMSGGMSTPTSFTPGAFVKTIGSKIYATSGTVLHFSAVALPTDWTTGSTGAGFIDMANQASFPEDLTAICTYQKYIAIFAGNVTFIWYVDPDPKLNTKSQILVNTGTEYPRSVTPFGDSDTFYLHQSGLRSLKARDASNAASTTDIGVPVDALILDAVRAMPAGGRIIGLINPADGRFWLIVHDTVFVFSFYANAKVSAWSTYSLSTRDADGAKVDFVAAAAVVWRRKVYIRSGDTIYAYGGLDAEDAYDFTEAEADLPFFDANKPTAEKMWSGIDAACSGEWEVSVAMQPTQPGTEERVATIRRTSFNAPSIPLNHASTHLSPRFRSRGGGKAVLSAVVIHFNGAGDED